MRTRYFLACLRLQLGVAARALPGLLAMALAALLLAGGAAAAATALAARGEAAQVRIAVAQAEADPRLGELMALLGQVLAGEESGAGVALYGVDAAEAAAEVRSGKAAAALLLPRGFWDSLMTGENLPPTLMVDTARPLEALLVAQLAQSAARMLADAQQGIAFTLALRELAAAGGSEVPAAEALAQGINLEYALWALGRDSTFRAVTVSPAGTLPPAQSVALYAAVYLLALAAPALYRLFALRPQAAWLGRLRGIGHGSTSTVLAQLLAGALALLPALALLLLGVWLAGALPLFGGGAAAATGGGWWWALPGLAAAALVLACLGWLCCNAGGPLAAGGLAFLVATALLATAGGLLPRVLLPAPLAALAPYNPLGWAHAALAPLLGSPAAPGALAGLLALATALGGLCLLAARGRRAAA